jgi:hypothetical protein
VHRGYLIMQYGLYNIIVSHYEQYSSDITDTLAYGIYYTSIYRSTQCALPVISIMDLWQLLNLGSTVTHWVRIALWSHQSAQTASSERCIMRIVSYPQGDSPPNPRVLKLREQ